jgi:hypothetical protein
LFFKDKVTTFTVYLRSGQSISVKAKDVKLTRSDETGVVNSYAFEGVPKHTNRPVYIIPTEIVAIVRNVGWFE